MTVVDKFKDLIGIEEIDDEDIIDEEDDEMVERRRVDSRSGYPRGGVRDKVVNMNRGGGNPFKLMVIEPTGFEECPKLVDSLKTRKPVIINLEKIDSDTARKIFDFLSGATYALNGNVQKVANNIFIFAPENVDITSTNETEGKGFDFGATQKDTWR